MRRCGTLLTLLLFTLVVGGTSHATSTYVTLEKGIKRSGPQYRSVRLKKDSPELCQEACAKDGECKAYTYIKPGVQGPRARCLLIKGRIASTERSDCCVSGVKRTRSPTATTSPSVSGPAAKMAAPKVQADRFSPRASGTKRPTYRNPSTTNTPSPVVRGDEIIYKREPFSFTTDLGILSGREGRYSYIVPDEYLFVIETISVRCEFSRGEQPEGFWVRALLGPEKLKVSGNPSSKFAKIHIPLSKQYERDSGSTIWVGTQQVRTYASPGSLVILKYRANREPSHQSVSYCSCSLSGYQLDPYSPSLAP